MASSTPGTVTKIYRLETQGLDSVLSDLGTVGKAFDSVAKSRQKYADVMEKVRTKQGEESQAFQNAKKNYDDASRSLENLSTKQKSLTSDKDALIRMQKLESDGTAKAVSQYTQLVNSYKEAKTRAEELAAEYGVNDERAKVAAVSAAAYKQELKDINDLLKNPRPASDNVPFTSNMAELEAEALAAQKTGVAVNELNVAEAEAANAATAMGVAQKEASVSTNQTAQAVTRLITPYQEYTGTLQANIQQNIQYKTRLAEISAELKAGTGNTEALVLEQEQLKKASAEVSQTINAQVKYLQAADGSYDQMNQRLGLARNLMRQLSEEEKNTVFGKALAADITAMDANLKKADADIGNHQRKVGDYGTAFTNAISKTFSFLRQLAYILPGIGLQGIMSLLFEGIVAIGSAIFGSSAALNVFAENLKNLNSVMATANKQAGEEVTHMRLLYETATNANIPLTDRIKAVEELKSQYPAYFAQLDNEIILNGKAKDSYLELAGAIRLAARAKATETKIADLETQKFDIETQIAKIRSANAAENARETARVFGDEGGLVIGRSKEEEQALNNARAQNAITVLQAKLSALSKEQDFISQFLKTPTKTSISIADALKTNLSAIELKEIISRIDAEIGTLKEGDPKLKELEKQRDIFQKRMDAITKKPGASTLSAGQKNALGDIDALRDQQLAEQKALRLKDEIDEETYLRRILAINQKAVDSKLNILKGANSAERAQAAELRLQRIAFEQDTNTKIFELRQKALINQRDLAIQAAQDQKQRALEDPNLSASARVEIELEADQAVLRAREQFNVSMSALENELHTKTLANIAERIKAAQEAERQIRNDRLELGRAQIADIKTEGDAVITAQRTKYDKVRAFILQNEKFTDEQKKQKIEDLNKAERITVLTEELKVLDEEVKKKKQLLDQDLISQDEYNKAVEAAAAKAAELQGEIFNQDVADKAEKSFTDLKSAIQVGLKDILNIKAGSKNDEALGNILAQSYSLAKDALNSYYDAERARIQDSLDLQLQRLDIEKEQRLSFAQSAAERDAIEKQYAAKQKAAQAKAGEELKRTKKAEARIALATELANIWASVYQLGPIAGPIAGVVLSGLALGRFALRIGEINREKFEQGGPVPTKGGEFGGKSHSDGGTPFSFQGQSFEAEAKELAIIRTKNAPSKAVYNLSGTQRQIASALNRIGGGIDFASGARVSRMFDYGGSLGTSLSAPVYTPSLSSGSAIADNRQLIQMMQEHNARIERLAAEQSARIDRLQVQVVSKEVTRAQNRDIKKSSIGTL